jgi:UDP-N-acetylglucosamine 4,6-dehydratase/5-epimerase
MFTDKCVLITGGTGSLGHHLTWRLLNERQMWAGDRVRVRLFSRDEKKHYDMWNALQTEGLGSQATFVVGDVRHYETILQAMRGVDYVVHAAAMKHVPHCESHPAEAVRTNVHGAMNVVRAVAATPSVSRTLFVSTDKAVDPINVYGMTKAIQERVFQRAEIDSVGVRYGNVLSSSGSVVPFFRQRAQAGTSLPVTDEAMTRFFITFPQAVDLIVRAMWNGTSRSIAVPRLPSARIVDVAAAFTAKYDVPWHVSGTRPGEKLHEVLMSAHEVAGCHAKEQHVELHPAEDTLLAQQTGGGDATVLSDMVSSGPLMDTGQVAAFLKTEGQL